MTLPKIASRDEWLAARKQLLDKEKEATRVRDALSGERRELPIVEVEKDYVFDGPGGPVRLLDMFDGRRQLIVHHFMFDPSWDVGCSSCTSLVADRGDPAYLHARDTSLVLISRAPLEKLEVYRERMGWTVPWYSSFGSDFNYDFHVTMDESVAPIEYNYKTLAEHEQAGTAYYFAGEQPSEQPGTSCFLREDDEVFHTYSSFARGAEMTGGSYYFLDLTALGRQEEWEEPKGRSDAGREAHPDFAD